MVSQANSVRLTENAPPKTNMIEDPNPRSWRMLQDGVARIFREIGLVAQTDVRIETPRGKVDVDAFATDNATVDQIRYAVECKNWSRAVPQSVVHSFSTVMQELGANIGFIVSRKGLQQGAIEYTRSTNISGLTYDQFQERYFVPWFKRHFVPTLGSVVDPLTQYVEPFNTVRDRHVSKLSSPKRKQFEKLQRRYGRFSLTMAHFEFAKYSDQFGFPPPNPRNVATFRSTLEDLIGWKSSLQAKYYRDLLCELHSTIGEATASFDNVFGSRIFT